MPQSIETDQIWREFHECLLRYIRRRVATDHHAEDILQEVFARIHGNGHRLRDAQSVTGWVYRITRNAIVDHHRARAKAAGAVAQLGEAAEADAALREHQDQAKAEGPELAGCMEPLLRRLPEDYGQAIALTELGGITQKKAAEQMGLSLSAMKSRVQRGRGKLKEVLLECCHVELDRRRGVIDYKPRGPGTCCNRETGTRD